MARKINNQPVAEDIKYLQDTMHVIGGKWKLLIMLSLANGHSRFREIQRSVPGITARMLSKELKELEMNKIIARKVYDDSPVVVDYEITTYCRSFDPIIKAMIHWGKEHRKFITGKKTFIAPGEGHTNAASAGISTCAGTSTTADTNKKASNPVNSMQGSNAALQSKK